MGMSSEEYVTGLAYYLRAGVPVLMVDYALVPNNAAFSYTQAKCHGFVGLVKMRSLEELSATPSP
jgi:endo-alpha-1,4-polygalactosaminidase (GH114 family)